MIDLLAKALASGLFLSYLPGLLLKRHHFTGSGLVGSLWGVALLPCLPVSTPQTIFALLGVGAISIAISDRAEAAYGVSDDARIVIDEFIGYWIAIAFLPHTRLFVVSAFILFRIFDVWKGLGIARWGRLPGGWGVVMDDIIAGLYANLCLQLLRVFL